MNDKNVGTVGRSFWIIGVVALIWNILGVLNFFMQMFTEDVSAFPEWWRAVVESRPMWATVAMAIAVFGGALGCILLLLRKSAAFYLFVVSLLGTIVTMTHAIGVGDPGPRQIIEAFVMSIVVAALLIWYSKRAEGKGWIR